LSADSLGQLKRQRCRDVRIFHDNFLHPLVSAYPEPGAAFMTTNQRRSRAAENLGNPCAN
jgi:hypothetical protein